METISEVGLTNSRLDRELRSIYTEPPPLTSEYWPMFSAQSFKWELHLPISSYTSHMRDDTAIPMRVCVFCSSEWASHVYDASLPACCQAGNRGQQGWEGQALICQPQSVYCHCLTITAIFPIWYIICPVSYSNIVRCVFIDLMVSRCIWLKNHLRRVYYKHRFCSKMMDLPKQLMILSAVPATADVVLEACDVELSDLVLQWNKLHTITSSKQNTPKVLLINITVICHKNERQKCKAK